MGGQSTLKIGDGTTAWNSLLAINQPKPFESNTWYITTANNRFNLTDGYYLIIGNVLLVWGEATNVYGLANNQSACYFEIPTSIGNISSAMGQCTSSVTTYPGDVFSLLYPVSGISGTSNRVYVVGSTASPGGQLQSTNSGTFSLSTFYFIATIA